jgi:hypothetical protein
VPNQNAGRLALTSAALQALADRIDIELSGVYPQLDPNHVRHVVIDATLELAATTEPATLAAQVRRRAHARLAATTGSPIVIHRSRPPATRH